MIRFEDAEFAQVLPSVLSSNPDIAAISYAYKMAMEKIIILSRQVMLYANIDKMESEILDLMALEFRTQYYDENLPIQVKRKLIKNTLGWYQRAGTPSAVKELIQTVFGDGDIVEWFDYTEPPYTPGTFEIQTSSQITEELIAYFTDLIHRVKNARSHIRRITIVRTIGMHERGGVGAICSPNRAVLNHKSRDEPASNAYSVGAAMVDVPEINILSANTESEYTIGMHERGGVGIVAMDRTIYIYNK